MTGTSTFSLFKTHVHLTDGPLATPLEVDGDFWRRLADSPGIQDGRLLSLVHVAEDWDAWGMHPEGNEIVLLLWGEVELVLEENGHERSVALAPGHPLIVPPGAWHTMRVRQPSNVLHITRDRGTQHRPALPGNRVPP